MIFWTKMTAALGVLLVGTVLLTSALSSGTPASPIDEPKPSPIILAESKEKLAAKLESPREDKKDETPLERTLRKWQEGDDCVSGMRVRFTRTNTDKMFDRKTVQHGQVLFKSPGMVRIDLLNKDDHMEFILLIESGTLHYFNFANKSEIIAPLPPRKAPAQKEKRSLNPLVSLLQLLADPEVYADVCWFHFPLAKETTARCEVRLAKQDDWYVYLDTTPRNRQNLDGFLRGRVVLLRDSYRVRQVWYECPDHSEILIDFLDHQTKPDPPITRELLLKGLPKGWKRIDLLKNARDAEEKLLESPLRR